MPCRCDVFWELSLPLAREAPSFPRSVLSSGEPKSVKHCLEAFFAGEKLEVRRARSAQSLHLQHMINNARTWCFPSMLP